MSTKGCPSVTCTREFQGVVNPWWGTFPGGCNCNHETTGAMKGMASWDVAPWDFGSVKVMGGQILNVYVYV